MGSEEQRDERHEDADAAGVRVPLGEVFQRFPCRINLKKALKRLGLKRKRIDRLWSRKQLVDDALLADLKELCDCLEEVVFEESEEAGSRAREIVDSLYPSGEPDEVIVAICGPDWLDPTVWVPDSNKVSPKTARAILHRLDGLWLEGGAVEVHCTPPIRPGKKPQRRYDEKTRKRRLFSRWHEGIRVDEEGLYSLTPEGLALEMVEGLSGVVLDGTCGVGALAIAAARQTGVRKVIAVDSSRARLDMARHNAGIYGVDDRIEWIHGRLEECLPIEADVLLLDPPWGGRDYDRKGVALGDLAMPVLEVLTSFSGPVVLKLPKSFLISGLPGDWRVCPAVDDSGYIKFLVASRDSL